MRALWRAVSGLFAPAPPAAEVPPPERPPLQAMVDAVPTEESSRFAASDPGLVEHLDTHGYVVVKEVASPDEVARALDLLWDHLQGAAGWSREDPGTWTDESFTKLGDQFTGILHSSGIGNSDYLWYLRTRPRVKEAFAAIWGTDDLITSFDGANVFRPWHLGHGAATVGGWIHVDQGKLKRGRQAVQGLVAVTDQTPGTGGLVVVPGSHHHHDEFVEAQGGSRDFVFVDQTAPGVAGVTMRLVVCRAGDLVLWDSRTVHCNSPAIGEPGADPGWAAGTVTPSCEARAPAPEPAPPGLLRAVGYVCMTPRSKASEEILCARRRAYEERRTTSHWPHTPPSGLPGHKLLGMQQYEAAPRERQDLIDGGLGRAG